MSFRVAMIDKAKEQVEHESLAQDYDLNGVRDFVEVKGLFTFQKF